MELSRIISVPGIAQWGLDHHVHAVMNSQWGWPVAEIVHFVGICLLFGAVGMFDLRMIGIVRGLPLSALHRLIPFGVAGFVLSAGSGCMFVIAAPAEYIDNPAWQLKMLLMGIAGANMLLFYAAVGRKTHLVGADGVAPLAARLAAALSLGCWLGVIAFGRVITAFRPFVG